ncbi:MAG: hypothetical protein E7345_03795 [Clostridiales bacterium]|nr:hypothetical protein [Clostridiales bacterium]
MRFLETFNNETPLFLEENNKKYKKQLNEINTLINQISIKYTELSNDLTSQEHKSLIASAKEIQSLFTSKKLKLDVVVENLNKATNQKIAEFNNIKNKLLSALSEISNPQEAIVCLFNIENNDFTPCEEGKEVVILGEHNNIIGNIIDIVNGLIVENNYETIEQSQTTFNYTTLENNTNTCKSQAGELFGHKQGKLDKYLELINKLEESGKVLVNFYTMKENLIKIGCPEKTVKDFENELNKSYLPLVKTLQKDLKVDLDDISNVNTSASKIASSMNTINQLFSATLEKPSEEAPTEETSTEDTNTNLEDF